MAPVGQLEREPTGRAWYRGPEARDAGRCARLGGAPGDARGPRLRRRPRVVALTLLAALAMACARAQPPAPVQPAVEHPLAPQAAPADEAEWNIFPDPITGRVEVYRGGLYVGSITGNEPEDPPVPRRLEEPEQD